MKSVKDVYKRGKGPSSSHTMGPQRAAEIFLKENPSADSFKAVLYGSLAKTGKGHRTDGVIEETFSPIPCEVIFDRETADLPHENTLDLFAIKAGNIVSSLRVISVGGGDIEIVGRPKKNAKDVYPHSTFREIAEYCKAENIRLS
ncbi:MAG: serine dehydratase, partial [Clostridia bacterium]|nr:serine dehydratase [Clostridia bacterium]